MTTEERNVLINNIHRMMGHTPEETKKVTSFLEDMTDDQLQERHDSLETLAKYGKQYLDRIEKIDPDIRAKMNLLSNPKNFKNGSFDFEKCEPIYNSICERSANKLAKLKS